MKLYLSSYRLGNKTDELVSLIKNNRKVAVIPNALDFSTDLDRRAKSQQREFEDLQGIGLEPEELDLREYFNKQSELIKKIQGYGLIWVRGGNAFVLRRAMAQSGFDSILRNLRSQDNHNIVYGGYSAGVCVIGPTLRGIEIVDDPTIVPDGYDVDTIWDGVGLVDFSFAPHYKSDHPESAAIEKLVQFYSMNNMKYEALSDGEAMLRTV